MNVRWRLFEGATTPFSIPFRVSAHDSRVWIAPETGVSDASPWDVLNIRGINWAGFQAHGCVHEYAQAAHRAVPNPYLCGLQVEFPQKDVKLCFSRCLACGCAQVVEEQCDGLH